MEKQVSMELVDRIYQCHCSSIEEWQEGHPVESWIDRNGNICVRYESGKYWHYKPDGSGFTWW